MNRAQEFARSALQEVFLRNLLLVLFVFVLILLASFRYINLSQQLSSLKKLHHQHIKKEKEEEQHLKQNDYNESLKKEVQGEQGKNRTLILFLQQLSNSVPSTIYLTHLRLHQPQREREEPFLSDPLLHISLYGDCLLSDEFELWLEKVNQFDMVLNLKVQSIQYTPLQVVHALEKDADANNRFHLELNLRNPE